MTRNTLINIGKFLILVLVQVLIFSRIHLFGYATACIYPIFILKLPRHTSVNALLVWSFLFGITVDMFCDTPGINAAAATAMGFARNTFLAAFTHKGLPDDFIPGAKSIKWGSYLVYSLMCIVLFFSVLFLLELFTIDQMAPLLISTASSTLLTMLFVIVAECFSFRK
ncbi:MAG: rod shape-determining protein MreD [Bacteroidaceae bacterium]|jgi:hypothetical protein|nr:rod shape-determining protein MreD [Bacteroidaceae bacterium]